MRKILYISTFISFLTVSCQTNTTGDKLETTVNEHKPTPEEYEIELISQTITELIHPTPPPPPPPISGSKESEKEYKERMDKEKKNYQLLLDTTLFTFYLFDTLIVPNGRYVASYGDTAYFGLAKYLLSDTLVTRKIDLNKINNIKPYKLLTSKPDKDWPDWADDFLGVAQYSRIIFNNDYSLAFFYFDFHCGELCGSGHLILAERKGGKWRIIRNDMLWVA